MAYGLIATPGVVDSHVHAITPELLPVGALRRRHDADHRGLRGAAVGHGADLLEALEGWPFNVGLQACARSEDEAPLEELLEVGAIGFKIHEDYGAYPELIDARAALRRRA